MGWRFERWTSQIHLELVAPQRFKFYKLEPNFLKMYLQCLKIFEYRFPTDTQKRVLLSHLALLYLSS